MDAYHGHVQPGLGHSPVLGDAYGYAPALAALPMPAAAPGASTQHHPPGLFTSQPMRRPVSPPPAPTLTVTKATPHKDRAARGDEQGSPCARRGGGSGGGGDGAASAGSSRDSLELGADEGNESEDSEEERRRTDREKRELQKKDRQREQGRDRQRRKRAKDRAAREAARASADPTGLTLTLPADAAYAPSAYSAPSTSSSYSYLPMLSPSAGTSFALATPSGQSSPGLISPALSTGIGGAAQEWDMVLPTAPAAPAAQPYSTNRGGLAVPRRTKARAASTSIALGLSALTTATTDDVPQQQHQPKRRRSEDPRSREIGLGVFMPPQQPHSQHAPAPTAALARPMPRRTISEPEGARDVFSAGAFTASPPRSPTPPPVPSLPDAYRSGTRTRANTASTSFSQEACQSTAASTTGSAITTPAGSMYDMSSLDLSGIEQLAPAAQFAHLLLLGPKVNPHVRDGLARLGLGDGALVELHVMLERAFDGLGLPRGLPQQLDLAMRPGSSQATEPTPVPTPVLGQQPSRPASPQHQQPQPSPQHQQQLFTTPAPVRKARGRPNPITLPAQPAGFHSPHAQSPLYSPGFAQPLPVPSPQPGQQQPQMQQGVMPAHHTRTRTLSRLSMPHDTSPAPASAPPTQSVHAFHVPASAQPMSALIPTPSMPTPIRIPATPPTYDESPSAASLQTPSTGQGIFPTLPDGQAWQLASAPARMDGWNGLESPLPVVPKRGYPVSAMQGAGGHGGQGGHGGHGGHGAGVQMTPTQQPHARAQVHHTPTHFAQPAFAQLHPQTPSSATFGVFDTPVRSTQQAGALGHAHGGGGAQAPMHAQTPSHGHGHGHGHAHAPHAHATPQQYMTPGPPARADFAAGAHAGLELGLGDAAPLGGDAGQAGTFYQPQPLFLGHAPQEALALAHGGHGQGTDGHAHAHRDQHGMAMGAFDGMHAAAPFSVRQ